MCRGPRGEGVPSPAARPGPPAIPEPRGRLRPPLGPSGAGGPGAPPGRRLRPLPPRSPAPDITPREAGSGRRAPGEEAPRHREGGGRARSPGPEFANSPAASPRAQPARRCSRQRPVSGARGREPRGAGAAGAGGARARAPRLRRGSLQRDLRRDRTRPVRAEAPGSAPLRGRGLSARSRDPEFHLPTPGLPPSPLAPRRAGGRAKFGEEAGRRPSPLPASLPGRSEASAAPWSREGPQRLGAPSLASLSGRDRLSPGPAGGSLWAPRRLRCAPQRRGAASPGLGR